MSAAALLFIAAGSVLVAAAVRNEPPVMIAREWFNRSRGRSNPAPVSDPDTGGGGDPFQPL